MKLAVRVSSVDHVAALWCFAVTFDLFVTNRSKAQTDSVSFEHFIVTQQMHFACCFVDDNMGDFRPVVGAELAAASKGAE